MSEKHFNLPVPISGPTSAVSTGLNDDGQLDEVIFILGGCASPYVPIESSSSSPSSLPFSEEYQCPQLSKANYVFDPKNHTNEFNDDPNYGANVIIYSARDMPVPRHKHASLAIGGKIWVIGGRDADGNIISQVDVYDSLKNAWTTLDQGLEAVQIPDININGNDITDINNANVNDNDNVNDNAATINYNGISDHCMFDLGATIILTGGYDADYTAMGHTILIDTAASLDSNALVYKLASPLNVPRGGCAAVSHGSDQNALAYVSGGFTHEDGYCEAMTSVERFDVASGQWILLDKNQGQGQGQGQQRDGVKYSDGSDYKRNTGLTIGRAHHSLFYYMGHIVAFGGEKRGTFDPSTGKCMDRYEAMEDLTLEMAQNRPNRLTFPIDTDEVELLDLADGGRAPAEENDLIPWVTKKTVLVNNEKVRFSIVSYPTLSKVFMFGGVHFDLEAITTFTTTSSTSCTNCFDFSSNIDVFIDPLHDESRLFMNIVFLLLLSASFAVFLVSTSKRCCRRRQQQQQYSTSPTATNNNGVRSTNNSHNNNDPDDTRRNEQGMLIQDEGNFWGGDAFSTDLDVEEMEWNNENAGMYSGDNLEMRQIT